ncbi:MurT ligase domain-containing protein [Adlercreutzia sp. ZJ304]|uniref:MurT ligase domain-containing protein n=1 Tax=Adlercreutzia sp. ZJ304 TaxID=2709791 RepID=UPI001F1520DD|nr:MurT ligase domain-containing protein [Adlercreutzia sp. ZJ304]
MGIRFGIAKTVARGLHWGLTNVARRAGATLPGKMAMRLDPQVIQHARGVLRSGSVVVAGTNGKTTCTNLLADSLEQAGFSVCCNRTGANLAYGVASALLECRGADWGVLESDELWLGRTLPALQPNYLVLLNLFRDQLDRCGEIDHIQDVIVRALSESPRTVLVYNADDPLCAMVARRVGEVPVRKDVPSIAFGVVEPLNLEQNAVSDTTMCQVCNAMMEYDYRQYGQLGAYRCPECGFARPALQFAARDVRFNVDGLQFNVSRETLLLNDSEESARLNTIVGTNVSRETFSTDTFAEVAREVVREVAHEVARETPGEAVYKAADKVACETQGAMVRKTADEAKSEAPTIEIPDSADTCFPVHTKLAGNYMVYNLLAVSAAAICVGCAPQDVQRAIDNFNPKNGRLQDYKIGQHRVLLNLAKNPTGFNQNLRIVVQRVTANTVPTHTAGVTNASKEVTHDDATAAEIDAAKFVTSDTLSATNAPAGVQNSECAIALFINDNNVDGHDISWIWDIDFEELQQLSGAHIYVGGIRKNDLQVRLKYAGVKAQLINKMSDVFAAAAAGEFPQNADVYAVANYTALAPVREELNALQNAPQSLPQSESQSEPQSLTQSAPQNAPQSASQSLPQSELQSAPQSLSQNEPQSVSCACERATSAQTNVSRETFSDDTRTAKFAKSPSLSSENSILTASNPSTTPNTTSTWNPPITSNPPNSPVVIAHMFPDLLNLYGDGGNVRILEQRLRWRGIPVRVQRVEHNQTVDLNKVDLVFLGGGPDREQSLAAKQLMAMRDQLTHFAQAGGPILAICGGYQILGNTWLSSEGEVPGLGVLNIETRRAGTSTDRLIDNIVLDSPLAKHPVVGYENHASCTYLAPDMQPFGRVISRTGHGNNSESCADGAIANSVVGTYLHGALLSKNPEVADWLLQRALARYAARTGVPAIALEPLDDSVELAANDFMVQKLV